MIITDPVDPHHKELVFYGPRLQQDIPMIDPDIRKLGRHKYDLSTLQGHRPEKQRESDIIAYGYPDTGPGGIKYQGTLPWAEKVILTHQGEKVDLSISSHPLSPRV